MHTFGEIKERWETSTSGKLVHLVCSLFVWMRDLYSTVSYVPVCPLLSPCIVGVDHLPAHQGVFRSVSVSYWIMDDVRMKAYLLWLKHAVGYERFTAKSEVYFLPFSSVWVSPKGLIDFSDAHLDLKQVFASLRDNATSKSIEFSCIHCLLNVGLKAR